MDCFVKPEQSELKSWAKVFHEQFPHYLAIGMSYDQYWNDDPMLVRAYVEADRLRQRRFDEQCWLQGAYIYDALIRAAPVFHDFAKQGTKAHPYLEQSYTIRAEEIATEEGQNKRLEEGRKFMERFMGTWNAQFKDDKKGGM